MAKPVLIPVWKNRADENNRYIRREKYHFIKYLIKFNRSERKPANKIVLLLGRARFSTDI